ncbi:ATP-binding protein (plasmid) [Kribbella sp. CA-253562]|uniref:ATP-binding protein n=1 Tax=Kribbella sp. CA-253562 TaxID=3239942 RepID=UPI003D8A2C90
MNRTLTRGLASLGLGKDRSEPPTRLIAAAPGLLVSETKAEAWFLIPTANTDLATETARDAELDNVVRFAMRYLVDRECHLKVVWGRVSGMDYAAEVASRFVNGDGEAWAEQRGARIDADDLPQRYVLLGVKLADRNTRGAGKSGVLAEALGTTTKQVPKEEMAHLSQQVRKIGQALAKSPWQARMASVEEISWMISREMHRGAVGIPRAGLITGAPLGRLVASKIVPYSDHIEIFDVSDQVSAYACVLTMDEFDEVLEVPGPGEWLRTLSEVSYVTGEGTERSVNVDASVRFTVLRPKDAGKIVSESKRSAKEQARSASRSSAGTPSDEVAETEDVMSLLQRDIRRDGITLVEDHPRLVVTGSSIEELEIHVDAVIQHYAERGIAVNIGANEQRDLWLESMPGDRLRVTDLGHVREASAFFGSSFWCGSRVGEDTGPAIGILTGSTPGIVRYDVAAGASMNDATTTALIGRSGRGKSTALMLMGLDAAISGAWSVILDLKGDLAGVVDVAKDYGIPSAVTEISPKYSGAADMFRFLATDQAVLQIPAQLMLIAPRELRAGAESLIVEAVRTEAAESTRPTTNGVIQRLMSSDDTQASRLGRALWGLTQDGIGSIVAGPPTDVADPLSTEPGLWLVQLPNLSLPTPTSDPDQWTPPERVGMATLRGLLTWLINTSGNPLIRSQAKVIGIPEVHLLAKTNDGASYLDRSARMGRAFGTSLVLDTQDSETIANNPGLVEQLRTIFVFSLRSMDQLVGAAELLGLPNHPSTYNMIRNINTKPDRSIWHGHCLMRDRRDEVASVQWEYPNAEIARQLNTSPTSGQGRPGEPEDELEDEYFDEYADEEGVA